LELRYVGADARHHHADAALLDERIAAEAAHAGRRDGEIAFLAAFEFRRLLVVHHTAHELDRVLRSERRLRYRRDLAVDLDRRREARGNEEVGALLLDQELEEL